MGWYVLAEIGEVVLLMNIQVSSNRIHSISPITKNNIPNVLISLLQKNILPAIEIPMNHSHNPKNNNTKKASKNVKIHLTTLFLQNTTQESISTAIHAKLTNNSPVMKMYWESLQNLLLMKKTVEVANPNMDINICRVFG